MIGDRSGSFGPAQIATLKEALKLAIEECGCPEREETEIQVRMALAVMEEMNVGVREVPELARAALASLQGLLTCPAVADACRRKPN